MSVIILCLSRGEVTFRSESLTKVAPLILVDTSVWVEVLRDRSSRGKIALESALDEVDGSCFEVYGSGFGVRRLLLRGGQPHRAGLHLHASRRTASSCGTTPSCFEEDDVVGPDHTLRLRG